MSINYVYRKDPSSVSHLEKLPCQNWHITKPTQTPIKYTWGRGNPSNWYTIDHRMKTCRPLHVYRWSSFDELLDYSEAINRNAVEDLILCYKHIPYHLHTAETRNNTT